MSDPSSNPPVSPALPAKEETPLTERELELTILAVMDALDANVTFGDGNSTEFGQIFEKLQRRTGAHFSLGQDWVSRITSADGPDTIGDADIPIPPSQGCTRPREGWYRSRKPGHEGPCASRPSPSASEITEAINSPKPHIYECDCAFCSGFADARSRLESRFREQQQEIERLKSRMERRRANAGASQCETELRAELASLKEEQLTEEEKEFIITGLLLHAPGWRIPDKLSAKLRALSTKGTVEK